MVEAYYMLAGLGAAAINSVWRTTGEDDQELIDAEVLNEEEWEEELSPVGV